MTEEKDLANQLENIQSRLDRIEKTQGTILETLKSMIHGQSEELALQRRQAYFAFALSLFLYALIGVFGNWFVTVLYLSNVAELM